MTPQAKELMSANQVHQLAIAHAQHNVGMVDFDAASVAILIFAVELATPELSPTRRASLIIGNQE